MMKKGFKKGNEIVYQNEYEIGLKCSNSNDIFIVSPQCLPDVQDYTWHSYYQHNGHYLVIRNSTANRKESTSLHRYLLRKELAKPENQGKVVDHIDRNTLNNKLENLRIVPIRINTINTLNSINSIVKIYGVRKINRSGMFYAEITPPGEKRSKNLGTFDDKYNAGLVYDRYIYNYLPENEWDAMNIRNNKIPQEILDKYNIDPSDPSTIPFIPTYKFGSSQFTGVHSNIIHCKTETKPGWGTYAKNENNKFVHIINSVYISEIEAAAIREQYLLDHPELRDINKSNVLWHDEESDGLINVVGIILTKDEMEEKTRGY